MTTNLTKTNKVINLPVIPDQSMPSISDRELLEAFKSPKVSELAPYQIGKKLNDAIAKAFYHLGYKKLDINEEIALQEYVTDFLKTEKIYQSICIDEIVIAIKRGSDRQYKEEFFGIVPATITGWIRAYMVSESRKNAKMIVQQIEEQTAIPKVEPTPKEQWDSFLARLRVLYSNYLSGIAIQPSEATFAFKVLRRSRIINFDESRRNKLKVKALDQLKSEKDPKNAISSDEKRRMNIAFEKMMINAAEDPHVISRAMAIGLIEWFDDLKEFGRTIDDAVNEEF